MLSKEDRIVALDAAKDRLTEAVECAKYGINTNTLRGFEATIDGLLSCLDDAIEAIDREEDSDGGD